MSLDLPVHGDANWDVKLNAALMQLNGQDTTLAANLAAEITRATLAEAANATAITAEATARATAITNAISALVNGAPGALDTLNELATALAADESAATTLAALVATKAPLASPTFTGTPAVPTAAPGTNTTQAASTAFTTAAVTAEATSRDAAILAQANIAKGTYAPLDARDTSITSFTVGMLVSSGSSIYRVTTAHAAPFDSTKATQQGGTSVATAPAWADATAYTVGNLVSSGTTLYRCTTAHTSSGSIDLTKFTAVGGSSVETVNTVASSGSAVTIPDVTTATIHDVTFTAATVTFTFPTAAAGKSFTLVARQDTTGSRLAAWPSNLKWSGNLAPTLSTGGAKFDVLNFLCVDGVNWIGTVAAQNVGVTPTLVTDSFTRADAATLGTADTGQTWVGTSVGIVSNKAAVKGSGVTYVEAGNADVTFTAKWDTISGQVRQVFRYTDANNYWFVAATGGLSLYKKVAGSFTQVLTTGGSAPVNGDIFAITTNGISITVKQNGATIFSLATDNFNQTATKFGLESSSGDTTVRFDDVTITAP